VPGGRQCTPGGKLHDRLRRRNGGQLHPRHDAATSTLTVGAAVLTSTPANQADVYGQVDPPSPSALPATSTGDTSADLTTPAVCSVAGCTAGGKLHDRLRRGTAANYTLNVAATSTLTVGAAGADRYAEARQSVRPGRSPSLQHYRLSVRAPSAVSDHPGRVFGGRLHSSRGKLHTACPGRGQLHPPTSPPLRP